jgi:hypothetical protein
MNKSTKAVAEIAAMYQISWGKHFQRDVEALQHSAKFGDRDVSAKEKALWDDVEWDEVDWSTLKNFHPKNSLLDGIAYEDIIDRLFDSSPTVDEAAAKRIFEEILSAQIKDARALLKDHMQAILKAAKK